MGTVAAEGSTEGGKQSFLLTQTVHELAAEKKTVSAAVKYQR